MYVNRKLFETFSAVKGILQSVLSLRHSRPYHCCSFTFTTLTATIWLASETVKQKDTSATSCWTVKWSTVKVKYCESEVLWKWSTVKVKYCESEVLWKWSTVKVKYCEVKYCESEVLWKWSTVKWSTVKRMSENTQRLLKCHCTVSNVNKADVRKKFFRSWCKDGN